MGPVDSNGVSGWKHDARFQNRTGDEEIFPILAVFETVC